MIYYLYRDAFSEVYTYRYRLTDSEDQLKMTVRWPGTGLKAQPETIFFENANGERMAYLNWEDRSWWQGDRFHLFVESKGQAIATIEEHWTIVDRMLLHLPRYRIVLAGGNQIEARGSRYSAQFYELFVLPADPEENDAELGIWLGEIIHPPSGPTYVVRTESPLLTAAPLLLTATITVMDLWGLEKVKEL